MYIRPVQWVVVIAVLVAGIFVVLQDDGMENDISSEKVAVSESTAGTIVLQNEGGAMEGHTPRGFQGMGVGLFAGDNLNPGFPNGDGVQIFLTFYVGIISPDSIISVALRSDSVHTQGTPFDDLGLLNAETLHYDTFSSELWNREPDGDACTFTAPSEGLFECDVTEALKRTLLNGDTSLQLRIRFEKAGDGDGEQDLVLFYKINSNTNEPGIFQLVITTSDAVANIDGSEGKSGIVSPDSSDAIHVPVVLHMVKESGLTSTGRSGENIHALFQKSQAIWDQALIVFDVELEETVLDEVLQKAILQQEFGQLYRMLPENDSALHIFFVRTLGGSNGIALAPSVALVADITTVNDFRATAHELGHLLGLGHTAPDRDRLLFRGANGTKLIDKEITRSRSVAEFLEP